MSDSNRVTTLQLSLHAQKLRNVAGVFNGTSDPYAVVTLLASDPQEKPRIVGRTEVIMNSLSPSWIKTFLIDYDFGKPSRINVGIYDETGKANRNKPMGSAVFEIGEILGSKGNIRAKTLKQGGTIFVRVQKPPEGNAGTFNLTLQGVKLRNVDGFFSKSDPFFELSRLVKVAGGSSWQPVYRSKHIRNDLNPRWEPVSIGMNELCEGDANAPLKVTVMDWEKSGKHVPMGSFETTVNSLMASRTNSFMDMKRGFLLKHRGKEYGTIMVTEAGMSGGTPRATFATRYAPSAIPSAGPAPDVMPPFSMALDLPPPSQQQQHQPIILSAPQTRSLPPPMSRQARPQFVDYISGGCELQMSVAIDFTGSNGDPRHAGTLHYIHPDGQLNDYEKALTAVGSIIARYDSDQKFPVWGFGAKFGGVIQHCFQLGRDSEVTGIAGILEAYRATFGTGLTMSGPTIFAEVINLAAAQARSQQEAAMHIGHQTYSILLILTDGAVSDINGTKRALLAASDAPISIVIVGIGNADFRDMQFLDDFQSQEAQGRDICQFVEFSRHKSNKISLTQATLEEIPDQLVDYFISRGVLPLPALSMSNANIVPDEFNEDIDVDLSLDTNADGEIFLGNTVGGLYDESDYGVYATYAGVAVLAPPATGSLPPPSSQSFRPNNAETPHIPHAQLVSNDVKHSMNQPQTPFPGPQPSAPIFPLPVSPRFRVQVPQGAYPGVQLQVRNPTNGQNMIVTVPSGVSAGDTFDVMY